jgi:hypothetical protein
MGCGCEQNKKPLKEALVVTKDNLKDQAYNAIYNTPISFTYQNKDTGGRSNTSYQKALDRQRKMGKPVSDTDKDKMVKELIPFLAYLYKKHLKAIVKEGNNKPTISKFIKENIRIKKNGDVFLKTKG